MPGWMRHARQETCKYDMLGKKHASMICWKKNTTVPYRTVSSRNGWNRMEQQQQKKTLEIKKIVNPMIFI